LILLILESGKLLIAEPSVYGDQNFHRSIVVIADHKESGFLGFIINKPLSFNLNDVLPDIKIDFPLFYGGPVEQDNLFFIHNAAHLIPHSLKIDDQLFWGGEFEKIISLVNDGLLTPRDIKFFLGYSGWSGDQLKEEINANSWVVIDNTYTENILAHKTQDLWKNQMIALGGKYLVWSNTPENPSHN